MIPLFLSTLPRIRRGALRIASLLGMASLAAFSSVQAADSVVTGDTFSLEMFGYNTSYPQDNIRLLFSPLTPTFNTTQTYAGYGRGNQTVTVSSSEYTSGNTITDFISVSVPSNFVPAGTVDVEGHTLNAFQFFLGADGLGGTHPLDYNSALSGYNVSASIIFNNNGVTTAGAVPTTTTLTNMNTSLSSFGVATATPSTADISSVQATAFSFTITYPVPEPSTNAGIMLGTVVLLGMVVLRKRRPSRS